MANHRPTVLIIEDERFISMIYEDMVTDAGLAVGGCFDSCKSAEEWLSIHSPDVAIIDIKLQDGSSAEDPVFSRFRISCRIGWHR